MKAKLNKSSNIKRYTRSQFDIPCDITSTTYIKIKRNKMEFKI